MDDTGCRAVQRPRTPGTHSLTKTPAQGTKQEMRTKKKKTSTPFLPTTTLSINVFGLLYRSQSIVFIVSRVFRRV